MHWNHSFVVPRSWFRIAAISAVSFLLSGPAWAQQAENGAGNAAGQGNAGGQTGIGQSTLGEGFQVERTGVVGESTSTPVGANAASAAGQQGNAIGGRTGGLGGFGGGGGGLGAAFGNLFGNANSQSSNSSNPPIRTRLRAAVQLPPSVGMTPAVAGSIATNRLRQSSTLQPARIDGGASQQQRFNNVNVQFQGRTAILTGQVRSETDRRMSHLMMRLEPGVSEIQNRIDLLPSR